MSTSPSDSSLGDPPYYDEADPPADCSKFVSAGGVVSGAWRAFRRIDCDAFREPVYPHVASLQVLADTVTSGSSGSGVDGPLGPAAFALALTLQDALRQAGDAER
jgi:hypothetical protein